MIAEIVYSATSLPVSTPSSTLPEKKGYLHQLICHPWFMLYNRLAVMVVGLNLGLYFLAKPGSLMPVVVANFVLANFIRQHDVINGLFYIATRVPRSWPLAIRAACAKVYHFGGIHVGAYFSGVVWLALYLFSKEFGPIAFVVALNLLVLLSVCIVSLPVLRSRYHNAFERIARFGNWISLGLFWIQLILTSHIENQANFEAVTSPIFLGLIAISFGTALPWLRMRRVQVRYTRPSSHVALANFDYGVTPFSGSSTELSRNPLLEWHSFANVPSPGAPGFRLTISRAGDWTGRLVDDLPEKIWVKGIPTAGVGNIEVLFKKLIWVATGSGIGPCLPHLLAQEVPAGLVWSTRNPIRTYGVELVEEIQRVQPKAVIWDTDKAGKPDLVAVAYREYLRLGAEAIICISNKKVTWNVVQEFESRGIPAFGAIWDS